jgi:Asp-tRNA(Asn)/Glu-tRNA(Gln) amidotransferase A subunit family amidase
MTDLSEKGPFELNGLGAVAAARKIEAGEITSERLARDCLARIEAREPAVGAWAFLDPAYAIEQARTLDKTPCKGPLHGVPVAIKDIIDTKDMPTGHGSPIYKGDRTGKDAACVAALRAAGLLIFGKAVTTEFASPFPIGTRNPHDPRRTPGVSSSGSAAAVADFMVPLANGTQTGGSVIGPAANCGVYGYKASLDGLDRGGIRHCKPTIDTLGLFARSVEDLIWLRAVNTGKAAPPAIEAPAQLRIGVVRTHNWHIVEPCMKRAIETAASLLAKSGARVSDLELPKQFIDVEPDFNVISGYEGAKALATEARDHLASFNPWNRERVEEAMKLTPARYEQAKKDLAAARVTLDGIFDSYDALLTPSLGGEAPIGLTEVRTATFNRLWTHMYTPAISLPLFEGPNAMPVCIQIVAKRNSDDRALVIAQAIDARLRAALGSVPARVS